MQIRETNRSPSSSPTPEENVSEHMFLCPFLGTQTDPQDPFTYSSELNNCFSGSIPVPISVIHQRNYCLSSKHGFCPVYRQNKGESPVRETPKPLPPAVDAALPVIETAPALIEVEPETAVIPAEERVLWWESEIESYDEAEALFGPQINGDSEGDPLDALPVVEWDAQPHPDFEADLELNQAPRRFTTDVKVRRVLVALLLIALIPLFWWLLANAPARPSFLGGNDPSRGQFGTMPTLAATAEQVVSDGEDGGAAGAPSQEPTAALRGGGVAEPTATLAAEPTMTNLEQIAATATVMFAEATMVTECIVPNWWVAYTIEAGDTIESLAGLRGITPELMIVANCLAQPELVTGETVYLPPVGIVSDEVEQATATSTATAAASPTRPPVWPTSTPIQFPAATVPVIIVLTPLPTSAPPTSVPPTSAPPPEQPPPAPTDAPTTEPTEPPPPTASPPAPPTQSPPTGDAGGSVPAPTDEAP